MTCSNTVWMFIVDFWLILNLEILEKSKYKKLFLIQFSIYISWLLFVRWDLTLLSRLVPNSCLKQSTSLRFLVRWNYPTTCTTISGLCVCARVFLRQAFTIQCRLALHFVPQVGLELVVLFQFQPSECWNYRYDSLACFWPFSQVFPWIKKCPRNTSFQS